jgi:formylglycine-generating enzyme required for sulfatase activity/energy-coupling factor transporter ATP-binding protein EcfA2
MAARDQLLIRTRDFLADRYRDPTSAARVASDASLDIRHIASSTRPMDNWQAILQEAGSQNRIVALLDIVHRQYRDDQELLQLRQAWVELQSAERAAPERLHNTPYRGLEYFDGQHAGNFFGRNAMTAKLVAKVRESSFIAVVGASGSGKSSLVRAGLIPALKHDALPGSSRWTYDTFRPGDDPLRVLALALVSRLMPAASPIDRLAEARKLAGHFADGTLPIADVLGQAVATLSSGSRLFLFADQFEEIFTLRPDAAMRRIFLSALLAAADTPRVTVLFTLRADFYGQVLSDEHFGSRVDAGLVNVLPMTLAERREAIECPARQAGGRFEEGLVERILTAVEGAPGDLPLLEFALTELWERQTPDGWLTHAAYESIGEVNGAIAQRADNVLAGLDAAGKAAVRSVFTRLVRIAQPDEGAEDTRRRILLDELPPDAQSVVRQLADARLLVTDQDPQTDLQTVEVAHEALIRGWDTLRVWLNEDREFLLWRQRLRTLAVMWEESGRGYESLLRGALLQEAMLRSTGRTADLSRQEQVYIERSQARAREEADVREAARQRELALERRARRRTQALAVMLSTLLLAAVAYIGYPFVFSVLARGPMASIAGGAVSIELFSEDGNTRTEQMVNVQPFRLEKYEVTNQQYRLCKLARVCDPPSDRVSYLQRERSRYPVTTVNAYEASHYCEWIGRRLPTQAEWLMAARGPAGRAWPWGLDPPSRDRANIENPEGTLPVGSFLHGNSPEGVADLIGNVWEWTASYQSGGIWSPQEDPYPGRTALIFAGSGFRDEHNNVTMIESMPATSREPDTGFRCATR